VNLPLATLALGKLDGWSWHNSHFIAAHALSQARGIAPLFDCRGIA
jgi:hypothetical protein